MMRMLSLNEDNYYLLRYESAIAYLRFYDYYEAVARIFILSPTFYHWWYNHLDKLEQDFVTKYEGFIRSDRALDVFLLKVFNQKAKPSPGLLEKIRAEGIQALKKNKSLTKIKVYD